LELYQKKKGGQRRLTITGAVQKKGGGEKGVEAASGEECNKETCGFLGRKNREEGCRRPQKLCDSNRGGGSHGVVKRGPDGQKTLHDSSLPIP